MSSSSEGRGRGAFDLTQRIASRRQITIACQVVRERDFRLVADASLDLSTRGMLVGTQIPVEIGEELIVSFSLSGLWIDTDAVVSRVLRGRRPSDRGPAMGLSFQGLSSSAKAALAGYLHGKPCLVGHRPERRRASSDGALAWSGQERRARVGCRREARPVAARRSSRDRELEGSSIDGLAVLRGMADEWRRLAALSAPMEE